MTSGDQNGHGAIREGGPIAQFAKRHALAGFLLVLLIARLLFLLAALDPSQERVAEILEFVPASNLPTPERPLYDREELYTGAAAEAIRAHVPLPLRHYRFMQYGSGSLLLSLALVPLSGAFGPSYLTLKLAALAVTLTAGLFWWLVARRWLGQTAAWAFGLLYLFAPSVLVRTALIAKGDHPEAMAIVGAVLYLATRAVQASQPRSQQRWALGTGLLAGLGIYVSYACVPVLAGVALVLLIATRARPARSWIACALGGALGLAPWLILLAQTSGAAARLYGQAPGAGVDTAEALRRARMLIESGFFAGYDLPGSLPRAIARFLWLLAVLAGWGCLIRHAFKRTTTIASSPEREAPGRFGPSSTAGCDGTRANRWVALAFLTGAWTHLASFCLIAPDASSRYLMPCYPLLLLATAYSIESCLRRREPRRLTVALARCTMFVVVVLAGIASQAGAIADSRFAGLRPPLAGFDWPLLGEVVGEKLDPVAIRSCPPLVQHRLAVGFGRQIPLRLESAHWTEAARMLGDENERFVWEGIGIRAIETWRFTSLAEAAPRLPSDARSALQAGAARYADPHLAYIASNQGADGIRAFMALFDAQDRAAFVPPLARALGALAVHHELGSGLEREIGEEERLRGIGYALYRDTAGGHGLRFWCPRRDSAAAALAAQAQAGRGPRALWEGIAQAFERDLAIRSPSWMAGPRGQERLAALLERVTRGLPDESRQLLREAGERARADIGERSPQAF
ncbi:MAG: glycosyltransferase family 39 protein [Candidatus Eisenbacteria bacterium]|nr:glycosyltransferase family 39 protein [Candidatus Eisenbacteria bacterium]